MLGGIGLSAAGRFDTNNYKILSQASTLDHFDDLSRRQLNGTLAFHGFLERDQWFRVVRLGIQLCFFVSGTAILRSRVKIKDVCFV